MKGINLLEKSVVETKESTNIKRKTTVYSVVILLSFTVLNLVVFFLANSYYKKARELNIEIKSQENLINSLKDREIKYHVLKEKMVFMTKIFKEKIDVGQIIRFFEDLENQGIYLNDLSIAASKVTFSAMAKDSNTLSLALSLFIESKQGKKLFSEVKLDSLGQDKKGQYNFTISLIPNYYEGT